MLFQFLLLIIIVILLLLWIFDITRYIEIQRSKKLFERERKTKPLERIVVSLTTTPDRIVYLEETLLSLLDQTLLPSEIAINVPYTSRKGIPYLIPKFLQEYESEGHIKIHRIPIDEGPASKLLPTLRRENDHTVIIVVDDDIIYHPCTIERLYSRFLEYNRNHAITNFAVTLDERGQLPSLGGRTWNFISYSEETDLLQGFSGYLVTKEMFPPEVYNLMNNPDIPKEALSVDDIWVSAWIRLNKRKIYSLGETFRQMPLIRFGGISGTIALSTGENKDFITDKIVLDWFREKKGLLPCCIH
jgi:hypothetical protein